MIMSSNGENAQVARNLAREVDAAADTEYDSSQAKAEGDDIALSGNNMELNFAAGEEEEVEEMIEAFEQSGGLGRVPDSGYGT